jgi:hypothetical protein
MGCQKCLAICTCVTAGGIIAGTFMVAETDAVGCEPRSRVVEREWCFLPPVDMPDEVPGEMPGRPPPNVTVAVSTSSLSTTMISFTLPPLTSS